jgi:ADP-heptose:LPS heptosyltransferase
MPKPCKKGCALRLSNCLGHLAAGVCDKVAAGDVAAIALVCACAESNQLAVASEFITASRWGIGQLDGGGRVALITGGIGDFFALESHLTDEIRQNLVGVIFATRAARAIQELLQQLAPRVFPRLVMFEDVARDFAYDRYTFHSVPEVAEAIKRPNLLGNVEDWSIGREFDRIAKGQLAFTGSSFLKHQLADISGLALPRRYTVIHPVTANEERQARNFILEDWRWVFDHVTADIVVVGNETVGVPYNARIIDLTGKTTLAESIEILKGAAGFVGVASCLSVLAAQLFPPEQLRVKGPGENVQRNRAVYFAPQTDFRWLRPAICASVADSYDWELLITPEPRKPDAPGLPEVTLNVVQGIGDIFWVYQRFHDHVSRLHLNVLITEDCELHRRAEPFLRLLPKVGTITYLLVSQDEYTRVARTRSKVSTVLADPGRVHEFGSNRCLEEGIRLEAEEPELSVAWNVEINSEPFALPHSRYAILYVSGSQSAFVWTREQWLEFVVDLWKSNDLRLPIVILGANYDASVARWLKEQLGAQGIVAVALINRPMESVVYWIKNAELFVGYQSGLGILADNFGVPSVMLYYPFLRAMKYAWCQPWHADDGIFHAFTFDEDPAECATMHFEPRSRRDLEWDERRGIARRVFTEQHIDYGDAYWEKYQGYAQSPIAHELNLGRIALVRRHVPEGKILDIGIGSGAFVEAAHGFGWDVNPRGIAWLRERGIFVDPRHANWESITAVTFWDSLEHMADPAEILELIPDGTHIFVSMPIFADLSQVRSSKHYRPNEHLWYFTERGLIQYMNDLDFACLESNHFETELGRESISSFAFVKDSTRAWSSSPMACSISSTSDTSSSLSAPASSEPALSSA